LKDQAMIKPTSWEKADRIARELARSTDRNELGKVTSFFQRVKSKDKFLTLLERLPDSGYVRSNQTRDYLTRIRDVCTRELDDVPAREARYILAWAFRRMTYYQTISGQRTAQTRGTIQRR
jgi:hypothetical protein